MAVGEAVVFGAAEEVFVEDSGGDEFVAELDEVAEFGEEPGVNAGGLVDLVDGGAESEGEFDVVHAAFGGSVEVGEDGVDVGGSVAGEGFVGDGPEAGLFVFKGAHDFAEGGDVVAS